MISQCFVGSEIFALEQRKGNSRQQHLEEKGEVSAVHKPVLYLIKKQRGS
jgi:hypothetical protein